MVMWNTKGCFIFMTILCFTSSNNGQYGNVSINSSVSEFIKNGNMMALLLDFQFLYASKSVVLVAKTSIAGRNKLEFQILQSLSVNLRADGKKYRML